VPGVSVRRYAAWTAAWTLQSLGVKDLKSGSASIDKNTVFQAGQYFPNRSLGPQKKKTKKMLMKYRQG